MSKAINIFLSLKPAFKIRTALNKTPGEYSDVLVPLVDAIDTPQFVLVIKLFNVYGELIIPLIVIAPDNNKLYDIIDFNDFVKYTFALLIVIFLIIICII